MWVFEEMIDGRKLTEIINETHENVKYLPNHKLPTNVVSLVVQASNEEPNLQDGNTPHLFICQIAIPDVVEAAKDADILIFVIPHQFITRICEQLVGNIKATAFGLSLIKVMFFKLFLLFNRACYFMCNVISRMKGFLPVPGGGIELISHAINKKLNIPIAVLMGANLAPEVADEKFCETTIGAASLENGNVLRDIIQTDYFRVVVVNDVEAVEMCGALKVRQFSRVQLIIDIF